MYFLQPLLLPGIVKGITNKVQQRLIDKLTKDRCKKYAISLDKICTSCLFSRIEINNTRFAEQNNRFEDQIFGVDNKRNTFIIHWRLIERGGRVNTRRYSVVDFSAV